MRLESHGVTYIIPHQEGPAPPYVCSIDRKLIVFAAHIHVAGKEINLLRAPARLVQGSGWHRLYYCWSPGDKAVVLYVAT